MADPQREWTEEDSQHYRELAMMAVPARNEQIATILSLLPFAPQETFAVVDLGCGEGALSFAILDSFPHASITALDGSPSMRAHAAGTLRCFAPRGKVAAFDLSAREWLTYLDSADCVVSSLCLHHLAAAEKQQLFGEVFRRLSDRGALIIADLVEPQRPEAQALFASTWDRVAEAQSIAQAGSSSLFQRFVQEQWNYYRFPDPRDQPSSLFEQLTWLKEAGFEVVDCFWLQAGHAIYGGYKAHREPAAQSASFATALQAAQRALSAVRGHTA